MAADDLSTDLLGALEALKVVARDLRQEVAQPSSCRNAPMARAFSWQARTT